MLLHSQVQRLGPTLRQPGIIRARNSPNRVLEEGQAVAEGGMVFRNNDGTHDDIGVAIDVLCETVEDNICTLK